MRIEIYKDWIIRSIPNNILLCKSAGTVTDKHGKETETFKDETSHRNVQQALEALCRKEIEACKATTFKGLQHEYTKLQQLIENFAEQLGEKK